jgi:hypothetical protein
MFYLLFQFPTSGILGNSLSSHKHCNAGKEAEKSYKQNLHDTFENST